VVARDVGVQGEPYAFDAILVGAVGRQEVEHDLATESEQRTLDGEALVDDVVVEDDGRSPLAQRDVDVEAVGREAQPRQFFVNDPIGTPDRLIAEDGSITNQLERDASGRMTADSGPTSTPLRFSGQYADVETGLYYNRLRYYSPETATYISPDPIGLAGGLRAYGYVSDPTAHVDLYGLSVADALARSMAAAGRPLEDGQTAHHIVPREARSTRDRPERVATAHATARRPAPTAARDDPAADEGDAATAGSEPAIVGRDARGAARGEAGVKGGAALGGGGAEGVGGRAAGQRGGAAFTEFDPTFDRCAQTFDRKQSVLIKRDGAFAAPGRTFDLQQLASTV